MALTIEQLSKRLGGELVGPGDAEINAVAAIGAAGESDVTFVKDDKHKDQLKDSKAGAVIVSEKIDSLKMPQLVIENVDKALIETLKAFAPELKSPVEGIDPTAAVSEDAKIEKGASIGPYAVIEAGAEIGENTIIGGGCKIGQNVKIGKNSRLDSNVVIYHNCSIGNNVIIGANSTIGASGFGYSFIDGAHQLIPHNGIVVIEDFVEIGANSCIDRAKFGQTVIGAGTKIDNLVQIAHNVIIGKCCLIAGQVGIAGSTKVGDGVIMAGSSGASDNTEIGDGAIIATRATVIHSVGAKQTVFGTPARNINEEFKTIALTRRLPNLVDKVKQLTKRVEKLEAAEDDKN